ncbi:uncharacterized protein KZ484_015259 [Pholidichthys leucotaenia]
MLMKLKTSQHVNADCIFAHPEESGGKRRNSLQDNSYRRVSVSIVSSQTQEKRKRYSVKRISSFPSCPSYSLSSESSCSFTTKDDSHPVDDRPLHPVETPAAQHSPDPKETHSAECPPSKEMTVRKAQNKNSSLDTLRQRHRGKEAFSNKGKEKKAARVYRRISKGTYGSIWREHPAALRLHRNRRTLLCIVVVFFVMTLTFFVWHLQEL